MVQNENYYIMQLVYCINNNNDSLVSQSCHKKLLNYVCDFTLFVIFGEIQSFSESV